MTHEQKIGVDLGAGDKSAYFCSEHGYARSDRCPACVMAGTMEPLSDRITSLESENARLRAALAFYADRNNWERSPGSQWAATLKVHDCALYNAGGGRARMALKEQ